MTCACPKESGRTRNLRVFQFRDLKKSFPKPESGVVGKLKLDGREEVREA